jgi:hypothetical protein
MLSNLRPKMLLNLKSREWKPLKDLRVLKITLTLVKFNNNSKNKKFTNWSLKLLLKDSL